MRRRCTRHGTRTIISCHNGISDFGAMTMFSETTAMAMFSGIVAMARFLERLPRQRILVVTLLQLEIEDNHGDLSH